MAYEEALLLDVRKEWIVEEKKPGVRAFCEFGKLVSRHGPLPSPGEIPESLRSHCIDGVLGANVYHVFDLPVYAGRDIRNRSLYERRALLQQLPLPNWFRHIPTGKNITEFLEAVERDGGEGVVLKSLTQPYGSAEWIKVTPAQRESVVVLECHEKERSVRIGQFVDGKLVTRGIVFLGSLYYEAWQGQVLEVTVHGRHPSGMFQRTQFVRFCPEKLATECVAKG